MSSPLVGKAIDKWHCTSISHVISNLTLTIHQMHEWACHIRTQCVKRATSHLRVTFISRGKNQWTLTEVPLPSHNTSHISDHDLVTTLVLDLDLRS